MPSRETKLSFALVSVVLAAVVGGLLLGSRLRGAAAGPGAPAPMALDEEAAALVRRLEQRIERLEARLEGVGPADRVSPAARPVELAGGSEARSAAFAPGAPAGGSPENAVPRVEAVTADLLEREELRDSLRDAIVEEQDRIAAEQEARAEADRRRSRDEVRDAHLDALAAAAGLSPHERDAIGEVILETKAAQLELEGRARDLLLGPGALTDEIREQYGLLRDERRQIFAVRDEELGRIVGEDRLRLLRQYERDQERKLDLFYSLVDWTPSRAAQKKASEAREKAEAAGKKR